MAQREVRVGDHFIGAVCSDDPTTDAVLVLKVPDAADPGALDCHPIDEGAARDLLVLLQEALNVPAPTRPVDFTDHCAFDGSIVLTFPDHSMLRVPWPPGHDLAPDEVEWSAGVSGKGWQTALAHSEQSVPEVEVRYGVRAKATQGEDAYCAGPFLTPEEALRFEPNSIHTHVIEELPTGRIVAEWDPVSAPFWQESTDAQD